MGLSRSLIQHLHYWASMVTLRTWLVIVGVSLISLLSAFDVLGIAIMISVMFVIVVAKLSLSAVGVVSFMSNFGQVSPPTWFTWVDLVTKPFRLMGDIPLAMDILGEAWSFFVGLFR